MRHILETTPHGPHANSVCCDACGEGPRREGASLLICWHHRYRLGDPHGFDKPHDYSAWWTDGNGRRGLLVPLYLYDHCSTTLSTKPIGCRWDSEQVGWATMAHDMLNAEFPGLDTEAQREKGRALIEAAVAASDTDLRGAHYGFNTTDSDGTVPDASFGYYRLAAVKEAAAEAATAFAPPVARTRPVFTGETAHG